MNTPPIAKDLLVSRAIQARERAYTPYSHYQVGAAVLTTAGEIVTGCNVENAVYPLGICAERVAIAKAVSEGAEGIVAVAVATENGGTPCGACRQTMREFADPALPVLIARLDGSYRETTLAELLPQSFSVEDLAR